MPKLEKYDHGRVVAYREWIPDSLFKAVSADIERQSNRKRIHLLRSHNTPESYKDLGRIVASRFRLQPNVAISKRYAHADTYVSRAYDIHVDPPEWRTQDLITCSIGGMAVLAFLDQEETVQQLQLEPNTVVRMRPEVRHMVSPPLDENPRHVIFLGKSAVLR